MKTPIESFTDAPTLFPLGRVVATPGVLEKYDNSVLRKLLFRHQRGDWGKLSKSDARQNDRAVKTADIRIFSSYEKEDYLSSKVWVITEWDRSVTTILLPSEY
jgi:hypothetical protein